MRLHFGGIDFLPKARTCYSNGQRCTFNQNAISTKNGKFSNNDLIEEGTNGIIRNQALYKL